MDSATGCPIKSFFGENVDGEAWQIEIRGRESAQLDEFSRHSRNRAGGVEVRGGELRRLY